VNYSGSTTYWQTVLQEILHKEDLNYPVRFTNVDNYHHALQKKASILTGIHHAKKYKRYYLLKPFDHIYLTSQEALCVLKILHCETNVAAAKSMNISLRTVEFYLKNVRNKLDCINKVVLLETLQKLGFFKQYQLVNNKIQSISR